MTLKFVVGKFVLAVMNPKFSGLARTPFDKSSLRTQIKAKYNGGAQIPRANKNINNDNLIYFRDVAQLGSAPRLGRGGRRFESCHPDHLKSTLL